MAPITVYTLDHCPYCDRAKALLKERGLSYEEVRVARDDHETREGLVARSGMKTFPQIFHGDELVGGFSELAERDSADRLASLGAS